MDYSKWNNIEISDDEEETYRIDRWRGQTTRVDRMKEFKKKKESFEKKKAEHDRKVSDCKRRLSELEIENEEIKKMGEELEKEEKKIPWNVDTISKPGFSKTLINTRSKEENVFDEKRKCKIPTDQMMHYGMIDSYYESRNYLREHPHLLCKCTVVHLSNWCVQLEIEEKHSLMERVSRQAVSMGIILDLAEAQNCDPRAVLEDFFAAIRKSKHNAFESALKYFKDEVTRVAELEKKRCEVPFPGGVDPQDVFESLPIHLKMFYETLRISLLQDIMASMGVQDYYL